jgi:hypothetical protein
MLRWVPTIRAVYEPISEENGLMEFLKSRLFPAKDHKKKHLIL